MKVFRTKHEWTSNTAVLPTVKHKGDAGMDFYALDDWVITKHRYALVNTGFGVVIPEGYVGLLKPKGANQHLIGSGVIDSNYRGEILIKFWNTFDADLIIRHGDAIGQMIILRCLDPDPIEEVDKSMLVETNRGETGGIVKERKTWD